MKIEVGAFYTADGETFLIVAINDLRITTLSFEANKACDYIDESLDEHSSIIEDYHSPESDFKEIV